jgi:carbamoyl-phosphate synthase large subunit
MTTTSSVFRPDGGEASPDHPVLIDRFLEGAIEVDVDAVSDAVGGVFVGPSWSTSRRRGAFGRFLLSDPAGDTVRRGLDTIGDIAVRLARRLGWSG